MSHESVEVLLARMEERMKTLFENNARDAKSRQDLDDAVRNLQLSINKMDTRLENVEKSLAESAPTIEEFITIKHKVVGAGLFGKWVWAGAGVIIGILAAARREIFAWFAS